MFGRHLHRKSTLQLIVYAFALRHALLVSVRVGSLQNSSNYRKKKNTTFGDHVQFACILIETNEANNCKCGQVY